MRPQSTAPARHPRLRRLAALAVLAALAAVLAGCQAADRSRPAAETTSTPAAADRAKAPATATAKPHRPKPTHPAPTDTPAPARSTAEQDYLDTVSAQVATMRDSMTRAGALFDAPRPLDDDWKVAVGAELAIWQSTADEVDAMTPPPSLASFHRSYRAALHHYRAAATHAARGIDGLDQDELAAGLDELRRGQAGIERANGRLQDLLARRGANP